MARLKQARLEGMQPESLPDLDAAAEDYDAEMRKRVRQSAKEKDAKVALIELLLKHKLSSYETPDGLIVIATTKNGVKVRHKNDDTEEGESEE